jgi:FkbM family methyltransferase
MGTPEPSAPARGVRRRDLLAGGLIGLSGLAAGAALGRTVLAPPAEWPDGVKTSYAQFGEDLVAASLLAAVGVEKPTYVDVGAFEPVSSNNTYLFYERGARGLLVEPNVGLSQNLRDARPGDKLLVAGIGIDDTTEADYYVITDRPQENTFDKEQAERLVRDRGYHIDRVVKMPLVNINRAIGEHLGATPDYLSIDVEGLEFAILKTLDLSRYRPKVICVDTLVTGTLRHNPASTEYMLANDYEVRGMSHANTLYVDRALLK